MQTKKNRVISAFPSSIIGVLGGGRKGGLSFKDFWSFAGFNNIIISVIGMPTGDAGRTARQPIQASGKQKQRV